MLNAWPKNEWTCQRQAMDHKTRLHAHVTPEIPFALPHTLTWLIQTLLNIIPNILWRNGMRTNQWKWGCSSACFRTIFTSSVWKNTNRIKLGMDAKGHCSLAWNSQNSSEIVRVSSTKANVFDFAPVRRKYRYNYVITSLKFDQINLSFKTVLFDTQKAW